MDFHSLSRRDLQFFCKRNKIPANMTNIAMADALQAVAVVEGMDEFLNQSESTYDLSPTSVAKNLPSAARTAARTTRRKSTKDETQSSELVTRSCQVTNKSSAEEMDQENRNANMLQNRRAAATSVAFKLDVTETKPEANVSKTPAARSTRRAQAAASSKKDESVQRVYSTRRAVKLLEESMADLSLKTAPAKKKEDSPAGSKSPENSVKTEEAEVISVRDLNDSLEKEWSGVKKNDPDLDVLYGDLGDISFSDANTMNAIESNTASASDSFVLVEEQETSQENDFVVVDHASSTTTNVVVCNKESESEQIKNDSESESEETEYETDPSEDEDDAVETNHEAFGLVSDKEKKTSSPLAVKKLESDSDEWSDTDFDISEVEENSCVLTDSESEAAPVSDKKTKSTTPAKNKPAIKGKSEAEEDVEMVHNNNGEGKSEAEDAKREKKKKNIDEESLKDVSMRQLLKMVKQLDLRSKQQQK